MVMTFVFLFAIAILPYAVQTFLHFHLHLASLSLYLGDFILVLLSLSFLRVRGLAHRRDDPNVAERLADWRRSVALVTGASLSAGVLALCNDPAPTFNWMSAGSFAMQSLASQ